MAYRNAAKSKSGSRSKSRGRKRSASTRSRAAPKRGRSSGRSRRRSSGTKKAAPKKAARKYTRYDPDTFVSARVTNADARYDEWLTATQMRAAKKAKAKDRERAIATGTRIAQSAIPAVAPVAARAVTAAKSAADTARRSVARVAATRVAVGAGSATVGLSVAAGLAILAGVASYYGTTWIMGKVRQLTDPEEKAFQLATAYRKARAEAAQKLGRPLTPEEVKYLGAELNAQLVRMGIRSS